MNRGIPCAPQLAGGRAPLAMPDAADPAGADDRRRRCRRLGGGEQRSRGHAAGGHPAGDADPVAGEALAADGAVAENGETGGDAEASDEAPPATKSDKMDWYILKVQSNREDSIRDGLLRRVKIAGLDDYFDEVIVPTETVSEYKDGKRRIVKQKAVAGLPRRAHGDQRGNLVPGPRDAGHRRFHGRRRASRRPMLPTKSRRSSAVHPKRHAPKKRRR